MSEKKRKMIDVDPAVVEMFARVLQKLKPPPKLTISEWADWFRQMSPEASAGTGRWHTDNAPYQREIMDAIGNPHVRMVVFKSSSQVGKTEVLLNVLGYYIDYNPAPILVLQPTVEMGQTFSKDRLAPMIRDTAVLRKKMDAKSRFSGNTIMQKTFPGGHVTIVGANSPAGLASRPIKIVLADEVDRYPVSAGTEGDPLNLAQTRQTTFWDKKTVLVSTPTIKGSSRIEKSWLESTMEEWTVPCPECGEYQPMVWANVVFDRERWPKGGVQYRCESCGCIAGEYRWKAQGRKGRYAALHPEREVRGFHLNVLASSFCAWAGIVTEFLSAKEALDHGNPELMKVWVNTKLGETWEERGETADDMALLARREMYTATVPAQVLVLTCGIDVQDDRFELELVGWGVGKESWGIRYQKIYGDPLKPQIWEDLDKFLQTRWRREDGVVLDILAAAMDTGGHHTDSVYRFCLDRFYRHVYAIKGRGGTETPFVSKPSTGNRVGVPLYTIGVDNGKTMVYQRLNVQTEGPNYTFAVSVTLVSKTLNDNSWATIKSVSDAGQGANYWAVGDTKRITLNGKVGAYTFSNFNIDVFILGFNHNSSKEGSNRIHFQIGKVSGKAVALCDSQYNGSGSSAMFHMNSSDSNSGGWNGSYMRKTLLGNSNTPASTLENSLMAALPSDLLAVMKTVTKYTDNTGGGSNSSGNVTATADYLFLLAEFEVFGTRYWANQYEQNSQKQYDYYKAGNSRVAYNHSAVSTAVWWWLRSAYYNGSNIFCGVYTDGSYGGGNAYYSAGLRPGFAV